ncbi:hypothetical protein HY485_04040, partial [Candidatus Woesearchaeota archaeon]|nr:hypothetical protein [Candidatus Woesearchaeota archaeon]
PFRIKHTQIIEQEPMHLKIKLDKTKASLTEILDKYFKAYKIDDIIIEDPPIEEVIEKWY